MNKMVGDRLPSYSDYRSYLSFHRVVDTDTGPRCISVDTSKYLYLI